MIAVVVGLALAAFGVARWVASSDTRDDLDAATDQVAELEDEAASARDAAGVATDEAEELEARSGELEGGISNVAGAAESELTAFNAIIDCLNAASTSFPSGRSCLDTPTEDWRTTADALIVARDELQVSVDAIEEDGDG